MAKKDSNPTGKRKYTKQIIWTAIILTGPAWGLGLALGLTSLGLFGALPNVEQIANPDTKLASEMITEDGKSLGTFFRENRLAVNYDEISPNMVQALVATEDERFFQHSGIDARSLARAISGLGSKGGGSTITQQLAKMQFNKPASNIVERIMQKFKEWIIAIRLERVYTKEEIVTLYLNQFDFLYQAVGIGSAARIYFNKEAIDLTLDESAILVAMAKNPYYFNPRINPEESFTRRNQVFVQMVRNGMITETEKDSLMELPINLSFRPQSHTSGVAPYFREYVRGYMKGWIKEYKRRTGNDIDLYTGGLKIYTTINFEMQKNAEAAVQEHLTNLQRIFTKKQNERKHGPFYFEDNADRNIANLLEQAKRRSPRYTSLKKRGMPKDSIDLVFNTPVPMTVFSWNGDLDTTMSPMDSIKYYKGLYQAGLMSVEPQTGFVKAWVGGNDYQYFKYDHVNQGKRQVGSTFKPFVYATAIVEKNYSPCMEVPNAKICIEKGQYGLLEDWCPGNSGGDYGGTVNLKYALANSMNTITTYLMKEIGPQPVIDLARKMGIESDIPEQPSIALGNTQHQQKQGVSF